MSMKKDELFDILTRFYPSKKMPYAILSGARRPSYEVMYRINKKYGIPFTAWMDIKSYIKPEEETADNSL